MLSTIKSLSAPLSIACCSVLLFGGETLANPTSLAGNCTLELTKSGVAGDMTESVAVVAESTGSGSFLYKTIKTGDLSENTIQSAHFGSALARPSSDIAESSIVLVEPRSYVATGGVTYKYNSQTGEVESAYNSFISGILSRAHIQDVPGIPQLAILGTTRNSLIHADVCLGYSGLPNQFIHNCSFTDGNMFEVEDSSAGLSSEGIVAGRLYGDLLVAFSVSNNQLKVSGIVNGVRQSLVLIPSGVSAILDANDTMLLIRRNGNLEAYDLGTFQLIGLTSGVQVVHADLNASNGYIYATDSEVRAGEVLPLAQTFVDFPVASVSAGPSLQRVAYSGDSTNNRVNVMLQRGSDESGDNSSIEFIRCQ